MVGAPPCMCHFSGTASADRVQNETQHTKKVIKKMRALRSVFVTFREPFLQAEYKMKPKTLNNTKKTAGAPPCISHSSGAVSAGRVQTATENPKKKNGGRSVLYFSLFGSRFCRQSSFCAGRVEFLFMFPVCPARICSYQDQGSRIIQDLGSRIRGSRIQDLRSRIQDPGSRTQDLGQAEYETTGAVAGLAEGIWIYIYIYIYVAVPVRFHLYFIMLVKC